VAPWAISRLTKAVPEIVWPSGRDTDRLGGLGEGPLASVTGPVGVPRRAVGGGEDEVTTGVDICPSLQAANLGRLETALADMGAARPDGDDLAIDGAHLRAEPVIDMSTPFGELKLIAAPAGVPRGYHGLRAGATSEPSPPEASALWRPER
jgi:hypothetical protein